jgi:hypothetical protein
MVGMYKMCPLQNLMKAYMHTNRVFVIKEIFFSISTQSQTSVKITEVILGKYMRFETLAAVNITIMISGM